MEKSFMDPEMKSIKTTLLGDKRTAERLFLPVGFSFSFQDLPLDISSPEWQTPVQLENIGGNGVQFISSTEIKKETTLSLKLNLPDESKAILFKGNVVWSRESFDPSLPKKSYVIGIKFNKMNYADRQRFVNYISDSILQQYINDDGEVDL